ncbi:maleylpyruvate isomerase family mycothiol-dependent enzyme [Pseudonocardia acaciae]|uniref:maleylpyruvate isomerase family mycothiol-dependent enzyme n=1 Tax=Pseudonocardia acaciae TaxID=551276 RepID=UPI0006889B07|nr:maleylpyruvate isomerase family mycothiol-dependent enzyme [Pseudonocardia acaciae]
MRSGTEFFLGHVDKLSDEELLAPSALPTWTRAHVVGHLARNAEALCRLTSWARTGVPSPMYASKEQRDADIESSSRLPVARLRSELVSTAATLADDLDSLSEADWNAIVRSAQGREIQASQIPWLRVREVWLHAVDLGAGARVSDLPSGVLDALLGEVSGALSGREGCPAAVLEATDRGGSRWRLGPDAVDAVTVRGSAAELVGWLVGRSSLRAADGGEVPELPAWL